MTSIKVHQRPGGNSSIDLFGGNDYGMGKPDIGEKPQAYRPPEEDTGRLAGVKTAPPQKENLIYMNVEEVKHSTPSKQQFVTDKDLYGSAQPQAAAQYPETFGARSGHQRTEFNIGQSSGSSTSVKVHHAPGGKSSLTLGGDAPGGFEKPKNQTPFYTEAPAHEYKVKNQHHSSNFNITGGYEPQTQQRPPTGSGKARFEQTHQRDNVFTGEGRYGGDKGQFDGPQAAHTSIKVRNPPGGASSISF